MEAETGITTIADTLRDRPAPTASGAARGGVAGRGLEREYDKPVLQGICEREYNCGERDKGALCSKAGAVIRRTRRYIMTC